MLLAIPFQGIASAAMLTCAHDAPHGGQHAIKAPAQHEAASSPCHEMVQTPQQVAHDDHDRDSRCSACAACCMGAAMAPAPGLALPAPPLYATLHIAASGRLPAVDLALPERPPRAFLA